MSIIPQSETRNQEKHRFSDLPVIKIEMRRWKKGYAIKCHNHDCGKGRFLSDGINQVCSECGQRHMSIIVRKHED